MADTTANADSADSVVTTPAGAAEAPSYGSSTATDGIATARSRFGKAIEEAKAGAGALKEEALGRTAAYKSQVAGATGEWTGEAKAYAEQAKDKGFALANEGKAKASDALSTIGRTISDTAPTIDEKLGVQYGDYARSAARTLQESAARLEAKELSELADDVTEFVRKSPGVAVGIAAVAGFFVARMFRGSDD